MLQVCVIQAPLVWEQVEENLNYFEHLIGQIQTPVDLIVLPEVFTTGFSMNTNCFSLQEQQDALQWMKRMADNKQAVITGSMLYKEHGNTHNRLFWVSPHEETLWYNKRHLFGIEGDTANFLKGTNTILCTINRWKIRPLICYDLRFPVWSRNTDNYDILVYVSNWPGARSDTWLTLLKARAIENQCYVIGCNIIGHDGNDIDYNGNSIIYNPLGKIVWQAESNQEIIGNATLDYDALHNFRKKFPVLKDRDNFIIEY